MRVNHRSREEDDTPRAARVRRRQLRKRAPLLCCAVLAATAAVKPAMGQYTLTTLMNLNTGTGFEPEKAVLLDAGGNLFGATYQGGANNDGTIFEISAGTHIFNPIVSFNSSSGMNPNTDLNMDAAGNIYGTTYLGGTSNDGTIFQLAAGTHAFSTIASFNASSGSNPLGGLTADAAGNLYGTTTTGGPGGNGSVYELASGNHALAMVIPLIPASFSNANGRLVIGSDGSIYGVGSTTSGANGDGAVFQVLPGGHAVVPIASFTGTSGTVPGTNPYGGLIADRAGNLYGTANVGGASNQGEIFEIQAGSHSFIPLATFNGTNGANPSWALTIDAAGNLFGAAYTGGSSNLGTIYELPAGSHSITTLTSFNFANGANPNTSIAIDSAGNLYGTTESGGTANEGTVFELSPPTNTIPIYTFTGGSNWNTAANWNSSAIPTSSVNTVFALNSNYSIGFTSAASAKDLHIAAGTVGFNLTGQSLTLSGGISVADQPGETANLTITGGSLTSAATSNSFRFGYSYIGDFNNSTGSMTLDGANWSNSASHLDVGGSGSGTLTLKNNSNLNLFTGTLALGDFAGGTGTVNLQSGSHIVSLQQVSVGNAGSGHLIINGGSTLLSSDGVIAADAGASPSDATITGTASNWTSTGSIYVGGYQSIAGSQGTLNVNSGGSVNITGTLKIWNSASTLVNLASGGTITAGNIDTTANPTSLNWTGGTLAITSNDLFIQPATALGQTFAINNGMTLQVPNNTVWINQNASNVISTLTVNTGGELDTTTIQLGFATNTVGFLNISGGVVNAASITFGTSSVGELNLTNGGTLNTTTAVTAALNTGNVFGNLNISGANSTWTNSGSFYLGGSSTASGGLGQLAISNGATLTVRGTLKSWGFGFVTLSSGSTLNVGTLDTSGVPANFIWTGGTLNISGGSGISFDNSSTSPLGANVSLNSGMTLISPSETVGLNSNGSIAQLTGSTNTTSNLVLGGGAAGFYTMLGGNFSTMALLINQGAYQQSGGTTTSSNFIAVGVQSGLPGTFNLSGGTVSTAAFQLGAAGNPNAVGQLTVSGNGQLNVLGTLVANSGSTMNIAGGTITAGTFNVSNAAAFAFTGGQLTVNGGKLVPHLGIISTNGVGTDLPNAYAINGVAGVSTGPTLTLENGGASLASGDNIVVGLSGGVGTVNVTGTGSLLQPDASGELFVGYSRGGSNNSSAGTGTVNISAGGEVFSPNDTFIGSHGGTGTATVDGTGSVLLNSVDLIVGYGSFANGNNFNAAVGTLTVTNGGNAIDLDTIIGTIGGLGTATISGSGSRLSTSAELIVGSSNVSNGSATLTSNGLLNITAGGQANSSTLTYIGFMGGNGTVNVTGTGSNFSGGATGTLNIGFNIGSIGLLNVSSGGVVAGYNQVTAGNAQGTGTILVSGTGSIFNASTLYLGGNSSSNLSNGTLTVAAGAQANILNLNSGNFGGKGSATFNASSVTLFATAFIGSGRDDFAGDLGPSVGSFTLISGAQANTDGFLVGSGGGVGTLTVDGSILNSQPFEFITLGLNQAVEASGIKPSSGTMIVRNTGMVNIGTILIGDAGGAGAATIDGTNSLLTASTAIYVGYQNFNGSTPGVGTLSLTNAGQITTPSTFYVGYNGGNGTANVGSGSILHAGQLYVGESRYQSGTFNVAAQGNLNISSGGQAIASQTAYVGDLGGTGIANINGSGAVLSATGGALAIGNGGSAFNSTYQASIGTLHLTNGGQASGSQMYAGYGGGNGTVTVDGAGSLLQSTNDVFLVGDGRFNQSGFNIAGVGSLSLSNGGQASSVGNFGIGCNGGNGVVSIGKASGDSGGTRLNAPSLYIAANSGANGDAGGTLNVFPGGSVNVSGGLFVSDAATSAVNLSGGVISTGSLSINTPSRLNWTSGTLNLTASDLTIGSGGPLGTAFNLSTGRTLLVSGTGHNLVVNGTLAVAGGTANVAGGTTVANGSSFSMTTGTFISPTILVTGNQPALFLQGGNLVLTDSNTTVSVASTGLLGSTLNIGSTNSSVNDLDSLYVGGTEYIGTNASQLGGSNTAVNLNLDAEGTSGQGSYSLQGGTLSVGSEVIGASHSGILTQSGGIHSAANMSIGASTGSNGKFLLQAGGATVTGGLYVGGTSTGPGSSGLLSVTGGQLNITGGLTVYDTNSTFGFSSGASVNTDFATIYSAGNTIGAQTTFNVGSGGLTFAGSDSPGITLSASQSPPGTILLNGPLVFTGATGTAAINTGAVDLGGGTRNFNISRGTSTVDMTLSAGIIHGSFNKSGAGILVLQGSDNFTSAIEIAGGTMQVANANALGTAGATVDAGATLDLNGFSSAAGAFTLNGFGAANGSGAALANGNPASVSVAGNVTLAGNASIGGAGNINLSGGVLGTGGLTKTGADTLTLLGAANFSGGLTVNQGILAIAAASNYTGNIVINGGTLAAANDMDLGSAGNQISLQSGGTFEASSSFLSGRAFTSQGGALFVDAGQTFILTGSLGGSSSFTKAGLGTAQFNSSNPITGPIIINSGTLRLAGPNGAFPNVPSIDVQTTGVLELNSALGGNQTSQDRVNNLAVIQLDGGTVSLLGASSAATTETLGQLNLSSGASTVIATNGSNGQTSFASTLTFNSLGPRGVGATVDFEGTGSIFFSSGVTNGAALGGWATVNGADYAKYSTTQGVVPFAAADYTVNVFTPGTNVKLIESVTTPPVPGSVGTVAINSLNIVADIGNVNVNQNLGTTLTLNNGGLIKSGSFAANISGGTLSSGNGELDISVTGGPLTITSNIAGSFVLTERGTGTLVLNGSTANTYTGFTLISGNLNLNNSNGVAIPGDLLINGGTVTSYASGQLASTSNVIIQAGTWNLNGQTENVHSFNNSGGTMLFNHGTLNVGGTTLLAGGTTTLASVLNSPFITISGGANEVQTGGLMQATSSLLFAGSSPLLTVDAAAVSPGQVILTDGAAMSFTGTGTAQMLSTGSGTLGTFNLSNSVNHTFTVTPNATLAVSAQIVNGGFNVSGGGTLELLSANTYSGGTTIGTGTTLMAFNPAALGASGSTIKLAGGALALRSSTSTNFKYNTTVSSSTVSSAIDIDVPVRGAGVTTGTFSVNNMTIGSGNGSLTVTGSDGGTLAVSNALTILSGSSGPAFLHLAANLSINQNIQCSAALMDITKDMAGTLTLAGSLDNSFGNLTVNGGTVLLNKAANSIAIPGNLTIANGSIVRSLTTSNQIAGTSSVTINSTTGASLLDLNGTSNTFGLGDSTSLNFVAGGTLSTGLAGTATLQGDVSASGAGTASIFGNLNLGSSLRTFNIGTDASTTVQVAANITSTAGLEKTGAGTLYLTGNNSGLSGGIIIAGGVLKVDSDANLGASSNSVTLAGGTLQFSQAFDPTANGSLTLAAGQSDFDTGTNTVPVTKSIVGQGGLVKIGSGTLVLSGNNSFSGGLTIDAGTVEVSSDSNLGASGSALSLAGGTLLVTAPLVTSRPLSIGSSGGVISDPGASITFTAAPSWVGNLTLTGGVLNFNVTTGSTSITGSPTLTIAAGASVNDNGTIDPLGASGHEVNVANASLVGLLVNHGVNTAGSITGAGNTTIAFGASLTANSVQQNNLTINGSLAIARRTGLRSSTISIVNSLNLGGSLDLSNNDLIVHNGNLATLTSEIKAGYNKGAWNGVGITSSAAAGDSSRLTTLAILLNSNGTTPLYGSGTALGLFDGQNPGVNDVLIKFTYYGDANLDGKIDGSDYSRLDNGFTQQLTGWYNGDFNYDGAVNGSDYTLIDNAYNSQGAVQSAMIADPAAIITAEVAGVSSVPEPACTGLLAAATIGLLARRRGRPVVHLP